MIRQEADIAREWNGVQGWLLLFCVGLTILGPFGLLTLNGSIRPITGMSLGRVAHCIYGIYVGTAIWRRKSNALIHLKVFFVTGLMLASLFLVQRFGNTHAMEIGLGNILVIFAWWFYFSNSKRVRVTLGRNL
jgi:hypothetical protein